MKKIVKVLRRVDEIIEGCGFREIAGGAFAPLREMGILIQAAVLAKAQRPLRRNLSFDFKGLQFAHSSDNFVIVAER
jgi:hypothetical protein